MKTFTFILVVAIAILSGTAHARAAGMTFVPATATSAQIPVYIARPRTTSPAPAVLMLHGCAGFDGFVAVSADRLAAHGYVAVALDSLGPDEDGCGRQSAFFAEVGDGRAVLAWLQKQAYVVPDDVALIGFSMGADAMLDLIDPSSASQTMPVGIRAAVGFYPSCDGRSPNIRVPLAIFDGSADAIAPAAPCTAMIDAAKKLGKPVAITTYPGATHAFIVPGPDRTFFGQPIRFDATAATDAAQQVLSFLSRYLSHS